MKLISTLILAAALFASPALAQTGGVVDLPGGESGRRSVIGDRAGSAAGFGETVDVTGDVGGDVFAMGRDVTVSGAVGGDLRTMSERAQITGSVAREASMAGRRLAVDGSIGGELQAAGETVTLGATATIGEDARLAGREIDVNGRIAGDLAAAAEIVRIDGAIVGDADVRARRITLGPNTVISGRFTWRAAEEPVIDPAAQIAGGSSGEVGEYRSERWRMSPEARRFFGTAARIAFAISWALIAFVIGFIIAAAAPAFFDRATGALRAHVLAALGWGLLLFFAPLAAAVVLFATLIGIPLGIVVIFAYPIYLAAGYALGAGAFGALAFGAPNLGARAGALALGVLGVGALSFLPWVGGAITCVVAIIGLGLFMAGRRAAA